MKSRFVVLPIVLSMLASPAMAQTTRVGAIAEEQAEKAKELGVEGPSEAERIIRQVLLSPLLSGGDGVYPWFGSVFGGTGMAAGVGYLKKLENASFMNVQTGISINNSMMARATFAAPEWWRGMAQLDGSAQWINARDISFYGYGQNSQHDARDRYDYTPLELTGNLTLRPMRRVTLLATYTFLDFTTEREAPAFSEADAPGLDQDLTFNIIRGTFAYDWRPAAGYSTRGGYYRASFERNMAADGKPYSFTGQEYELVQQVPLVKEQFVLAARGLVTLTATADQDRVPVALASFLGSGSTLRAFGNRRFTDSNRVLLTGEYRWRPSRYLDMALFLDAGQVAPHRRHFQLSEFDVDWGVGARFHGPTFNALRIEVARGREGIRMIFTGSQPF